MGRDAVSDAEPRGSERLASDQIVLSHLTELLSEDFRRDSRQGALELADAQRLRGQPLKNHRLPASIDHRDRCVQGTPGSFLIDIGTGSHRSLCSRVLQSAVLFRESAITRVGSGGIVASTRIFRIIMPAADLEAAVRFYQGLLEQEGMQISPGRHYFGCGGVILAVYNPKGNGDPAEPRPNFEHVYFAVADLDEAFRRAERVGGLSALTGDGNLPMGRIARRPWGERSFYMSDPFGNPLCFVDETTVYTSNLV
jgi:predicted enzyme related to lactoylglutathione lyase